MRPTPSSSTSKTPWPRIARRWPGRTVARVLESEPEKPVFVRVNAVGTDLAAADIDAVAAGYLAGLRLPKVEAVEGVRLVAETLEELRSGATIHCLIESALGLELAFEIATSHERVSGTSLGEADLAADLGVADEAGLLYARSRVVAASRAAGLNHPVAERVHGVRDLEGLRRSTETAKRFGFFGRSAIHPPSSPSLTRSSPHKSTRSQRPRNCWTVWRMKSAGAGTGAFVLDDGRFVDRAVVESAHLTLSLADREVAP